MSFSALHPKFLLQMRLHRSVHGVARHGWTLIGDLRFYIQEKAVSFESFFGAANWRQGTWDRKLETRNLRQNWGRELEAGAGNWEAVGLHSLETQTLLPFLCIVCGCGVLLGWLCFGFLGLVSLLGSYLSLSWTEVTCAYSAHTAPRPVQKSRKLGGRELGAANWEKLGTGKWRQGTWNRKWGLEGRELELGQRTSRELG